MFQSTRPRGRTRLRSRSKTIRDGSFNPRVLAGGRDVLLLIVRKRGWSFNPRVLAGGRDNFHPETIRSKSFQSTRPRGRTRLLL